MAASTAMAACVHVIDHDPAVRDAVGTTLAMAGFEVRLFPSAGAFLDLGPGLVESTAAPACLVLERDLPDGDGLQLLVRLTSAGLQLPAVLIGSRVRLQPRLPDGLPPLCLLEKPFGSRQLIGCVERLLRP